MVRVIKKNGLLQDFNENKIISACSKSAYRAMKSLTEEDYNNIVSSARDLMLNNLDEDGNITVAEMHNIVVLALEYRGFEDVAKCYADYRNYKQEFAEMMDEAYTKDLQIRYIGDKTNANTDSTMVSTQRSLSYGIYNNELYNKFFLSTEELDIINDGYIYIHDKKDRRDTINCCIFDMANVLTGGFEMGNIWYNEPNSLDVAFDVISDIAMSASAQQYGGFSIPEIDKLLAPYAEKSFKKYSDEYMSIVFNSYADESWERAKDKSEMYAMKKVERDMEQGFQAWEYRFNTVGSSRGDYPK